MIELAFSPGDVARVRFAYSCLWELSESLRVLTGPGAAALHIPWVRAVRARVDPGDFPMLRAMTRPYGYIPDFVTPPPTTPLPDLDAELAVVRATPPEVVTQETRRYLEAHRITSVPDALRPLLDTPRTALRDLIAELTGYWDAAIADIWPRLSALLEGDVLRRSRLLASGGASALFADLHPAVSWSGERLYIDRPYEFGDRLDGRGLLLVPGAFCWPTVRVLVGGGYQPGVLYPATGVATLWEQAPPAPPGALAALLGATRAGVLAELGEPAAPKELARRLAVTPGAVSQHLGVLRDAGLVTGHRVGRNVRYGRTALGDALVRRPAG
ncbi:MAG TPA: DUF5937 family protein [Streptosporangiaceae bacterium]